MNKVILAVLFSSFGTCFSNAQAKKPTIMVVPSDRYCISKGYVLEFDELGEKKFLPDYKKALQSDEPLRVTISQMGSIMAERGFPLKDLESELKRLDTEALETSIIIGSQGGMIVESPIDILKRTAKADIILDLDFSIKEADLGMKYVNFNLKGLDAYNSKIISAVTGSGKPYMTNQVELLLQMAVKDSMDNFNTQLSDYFDDMFIKGREIKVLLKIFDSSPLTFYDDFNYTDYDINDELNYIIEEYFARHTVEGRFSIDDVTESSMKLTQVHIPLFSSKKGRSIDARSYISNLKRMLRKPPFSVESKIYTKGLGEVWLILGEK